METHCRREWKILRSDSSKIEGKTSAGAHQSVLLAEAVAALNVKPGGTYVDGTYGRGGHSKEILKRLQGSGLLLAFDKDPEAVRYGEQFIDPCFSIIHSSFTEIQKVLDERGISKVDGFLIDLGVSSPQLDDASRGFCIISSNSTFVNLRSSLLSSSSFCDKLLPRYKLYLYCSPALYTLQATH